MCCARAAALNPALSPSLGETQFSPSAAGWAALFVSPRDGKRAGAASRRSRRVVGSALGGRSDPDSGGVGHLKLAGVALGAGLGGVGHLKLAGVALGAGLGRRRASQAGSRSFVASVTNVYVGFCRVAPVATGATRVQETCTFVSCGSAGVSVPSNAGAVWESGAVEGSR
jgi:hypothetical protein